MHGRRAVTGAAGARRRRLHISRFAVARRRIRLEAKPRGVSKCTGNHTNCARAEVDRRTVEGMRVDIGLFGSFGSHARLHPNLRRKRLIRAKGLERK
jgi:hypothetical protein